MKVGIKIDRYHLVLIIIILFFLSANLIWFKLDQAPPSWDQSHYLMAGEGIYKALTKDGIIAATKAFSNELTTKAPLITILPIPFYLLLGEHYTSALLVNVVFLFLCSYCLFKLVALISGKNEALLSVFVLNTFPLVFAMSREFLVEYGLAAFVVMWMYYLFKSNYFEDRKNSCILGVVFGLGMLMKVSFPIYIIAPTSFLLVTRIIELKRLPVRYITNMLAVFLIGFMIAGMWYIKNYHSVIWFAFSAGFGNMAKLSWGENMSATEAIMAYWSSIVNSGISGYYFLFLIFFIIFNCIYLIRGKPFLNIRRTYMFSLFLWFIVPFIVFTSGVGKDYRYTAPYLPAIAIFISLSLNRFTSIRPGKYLLFIFLLFPLFAYFYTSFPTKRFDIHFRGLMLLSKNLFHAHPPVREKWPLEDVIKFIQKDAARTNNTFALATLLFNHHYMNFINLDYYVKRNNFSICFDFNEPTENLEKIMEKISERSDYLLVKSAEPGPDYTNTRNIQVLELLNKGELNFRQIVTLSLPDQTSLTIYKKNVKDYIVFSDISKLKNYKINPEHSITFSDKIKLLDYKVEKTGDLYKIIFFWQCIDTIDLDYKIFVHVKDSKNNPVANADHYPDKGKYPTSAWKKGEIIKDEIYIFAKLPEEFHVYTGIYEETLGITLPVKDKPANLPAYFDGVRIY